MPDADADDLGQGAGFYVDATSGPWSRHFKMHDYVTRELPSLIGSHLKVSGRQSISGHSMGGHGALLCALRHPDLYTSASAFAPIASPMRCPWGRKAYRAYLGDDEANWRDWDVCALIAQAKRPLPSVLVDIGLMDPFLESQLRPDLLRDACELHGQALELRFQPHHDHSYYFIASFIDEHLMFHASALDRST